MKILRPNEGELQIIKKTISVFTVKASTKRSLENFILSLLFFAIHFVKLTKLLRYLQENIF